MGQIPILLRSKEKVQVEMDLYATGYNLIRLKKVATVPVLLEKLALWRPGFHFCAFFTFRLFKTRIYHPVFGTQTSGIAI
jgi:hypothetical protein